MRRIVLHVVLPLVVLGAGAFGARQMMRSADSAESAAVAEEVPLVEVVVATAYEGRAYVEGTGIVEAEREASVSSEVGGRVLHVSDALAEGNRVEKGHALLRIDGSRYRLALRQQRAQVKRAELEVEVERSAGEAARREWAVSGREPPADARRIALRVPQLELAEANVEVARAALASAKLDAERTVLRAPFNATITIKAVERGDYVAPGSVVARLVGTDRFIARVSVPVEELRLILGASDDAAPLSAVLTQRLDQETVIERSASVLRVASELDRDSRTAQVLLGIEDPLDPPEGQQPLLVGAFVTARIQGPELPRAVEVARSALVEGNNVWVVDEDDRLSRRTLKVAFGDDERVVATEGVDPGDRIVVTTLPQPLEGMRVRVTRGERA
jgi:membrane fusion protein, multidrug efflux system